MYKMTLYLGIPRNYPVPKCRDRLYSLLIYERSLYFGWEWYKARVRVRVVFWTYWYYVNNISSNNTGTTRGPHDIPRILY